VTAAQLLLGLSALALSTAAFGLSPDSPRLELPPGSVELRQFLGRGEEMFLKLEEREPEVFRHLSQRQQTDIFRKILKSVDPDADLALPPQSDATEKPAVFPAAPLAAGRAYYCRVDTLDTEVLSQLSETLAKAAASQAGLILDLRDCGGDDYRLALKAAGLFPGSGPLALLIGGRTRGAGELLASHLAGCGKALVVGQPSAGKPWADLRSNLSSGDVLLTPSAPPDSVKLDAPLPLRPDFAAPAYPMTDPKELEEFNEDLDDDPCVEKAVDLLIGLDKVRNKKPTQKVQEGGLGDNPFQGVSPNPK